MRSTPGAIGEGTRSTTGVSRGGTKTAAGHDSRSRDAALPPPVIDVETDTNRSIHLGGQVYTWPSRVAIVGYGMHGITPRVEWLINRLEDCTRQQFRWENRLNEEMPTRTL